MEFDRLFSFDKDNKRFQCMKLHDDEVYKVEERRCSSALKTDWALVSTKYFSRTKYEEFLKQHIIEFR